MTKKGTTKRINIDRLEQLRKDNGYTIESLSEKTNISVSGYQKIRSTGNTSLETFTCLVKVLNTNDGYLEGVFDFEHIEDFFRYDSTLSSLNLLAFSNYLKTLGYELRPRLINKEYTPTKVIQDKIDHSLFFDSDIDENYIFELYNNGFKEEKAFTLDELCIFKTQISQIIKASIDSILCLNITETGDITDDLFAVEDDNEHLFNYDDSLTHHVDSETISRSKRVNAFSDNEFISAQNINSFD